MSRIVKYFLLIILLNCSCVGNLWANQAINKTTHKTVSWQQGEHNFYAFDGVFYGFINTAGQGVKLWTPPSDENIRGVILFGNPGAGFGGDTRNFVHRRDLQEFAARHNFGVAGVTGFPAVKVHNELAPILIDVFTQWGLRGKHAELVHVPFIFSGGSNAAIFSFTMMLHVPERTIAITPNCGPVYHGEISTQAKQVPAWIHAGTVDPYLPEGVEITENLFKKHMPNKGFWAWDAEIKGHESGSVDHVDIAYWDALIAMRLSEPVEPGKPVELNKLDYHKGWWVDHRSWDHTITKVGKIKRDKKTSREKGRYGWLPNEGIAKLYQATASRQRLLSLSFADGLQMNDNGGMLAKGGDSITLKVDAGSLKGFVEEVEIYNQSEKLTSIPIKDTATYRFTVDGNKRVYALYARALSKGLNYKQGKYSSLSPRISNPLQVVVKDEILSGKIDQQLSSIAFQNTQKNKILSDIQMDRLASKVVSSEQLSEGMLGAIKIRRNEIDQLDKDRKISSIWKRVREKKAGIIIDKRHLNLVEHVDEKSLTQQLKIDMVYAEQGVFMLMEIINPDCDLSKHNSSCGMIDFHIASVGLPYLSSQRASAENYSYGVIYSLLNNALQFKIPHIANAPNGRQEIDIHNWDMWSFNNFDALSDNDFNGIGMWIDQVSLDAKTQVFEIFLPWHLMGNPGLSNLPLAGTSLATVMSYKSSNNDAKLSWPYSTHPWAVPAFDGKNTKVYGQIVFLSDEL